MPSGRRRSMGAMSSPTILLCLGFFFASAARAAVLGIDFGTLNIKAAIVKPGIPIDIVLTKDSKRKEVAALAFKPPRDEKNNIVAKAGTFPERAYGSDALSLQGRFPSEVFPNLKMLLGMQWGREADQTASIYQERYPGVNLRQAKELGTTVFQSAAFVDEMSPFSVEELIGMQLANIKRNAEAMAGKGSVVNDAVITIPPFYTADERRAIVKAANFAGLDVISLITDGLAVGLDYAKTRTFPEVTKNEKPEYHMVFDMGAGSATATVMRFQGRSIKDIGRFNKTVQEVQVLGAGWERMLGGDALNHVIMEDFVAKLLTKPALKSRGTTEQEIKKNGRVMSRFFKEAERVRQILSANTETSVSFEEILPDIDLRVKMTRADFERLAKELADRVNSPIKDALKMAKLEMKDLKSVILHGGAIRTPFVHEKLVKIVDDEAKLRSNVNPDESAVFGAAFKAASLSASFKVKEIRVTDIAGYATGLTYIDEGKEQKKQLFGPNASVGAGSAIKQVKFSDRENFAFGLVQNVDGTDRSILRLQAENLTDSFSELSQKAGCDKGSISTKFSIRLGAVYGLPEVTAGSVSCEVDDTKSSGIGDSVKGWLGFGKKDQEPLAETSPGDGHIEQVHATASSSVSSGVAMKSSSSTTSSPRATETPKKHLEVIPLRWSSLPEGNSQPSADDIARISERLKQFDASDKARYLREEAQNVLEAYTYFTRDFLENKDYEGVSIEQERDLIGDTLKQTREWLETGESGHATTEVLKEKYQALRKLIEPIQKRRTEGAQRPETVEKLQKTLKNLQQGILRVESLSAKEAAIMKNTAAAASSSASSLADKATENLSESATPSAASDDLKEPVSNPDLSSSKASPKPTETAQINPYDMIKLSTYNDTYNRVSHWLKDKLAEQKKLQPYEDPVLLAAEIEKKNIELAQLSRELENKAIIAGMASTKKPKPSKAKTVKKEKATAEPGVKTEDDKATFESPTDQDITENIEELLQAIQKEREEQKAQPQQSESASNKKNTNPAAGEVNIEDVMDSMMKGKHKPEEQGHEEL